MSSSPNVLFTHLRLDQSAVVLPQWLDRAATEELASPTSCSGS